MRKAKLASQQGNPAALKSIFLRMHCSSKSSRLDRSVTYVEANRFPSMPRIDIAPPIDKTVRNLNIIGAAARENSPTENPSKNPVAPRRKFVLSLSPYAWLSQSRPEGMMSKTHTSICCWRPRFEKADSSVTLVNVINEKNPKIVPLHLAQTPSRLFPNSNVIQWRCRIRSFQLNRSITLSL